MPDRAHLASVRADTYALVLVRRHRTPNARRTCRRLRITVGVSLLPADRCGDRLESDSPGTPAHLEGRSVAKAIHTMIRVLDLDRSIDF